MKVGDLTRWAGRPAQVKQKAARHTGAKEEVWAELHVQDRPQRVWAPVWALPKRPSDKSTWGNPTTADGGSSPQLTPTAADGEQVSSVKVSRVSRSDAFDSKQLPPEPEPKKPVMAKHAVVREALEPEREMPGGSFRDSLAKLMDETGVEFAECAQLLHTTEEAVEDMLAGERPPFHPMTCNGYRDLAGRLGVSWAEMQRRAAGDVASKKKVSRAAGKKGRASPRGQEEMFELAWEPAKEGR